MKLLALKECDTDTISNQWQLEHFDDIDVSMDKMIIFTSDGASVMFGCCIIWYSG